MTDAGAEFSVGQLLRVLRRHLWLLAQFVVIAAGIGVVLALRSDSAYEASATALVQSSAVSGAAASSGGLSAAAAARLVRTRAVAEHVRDALGDKQSVGSVLGRISTRTDETGGFVIITGRGDTPAKAARLANVVADAFVSVRREAVAGRIARAIAEGERQLDLLPPGGKDRRSLSAELADLRATATLSDVDVALIDPAIAPALRNDLRPLWHGLIGAFLGLLIGLVLVFTREALDPRVRSLEELRRLVRAPQLAALPTSVLRRSSRRQVPVLGRDRREPFEHLRAALLVFGTEHRLGRLVVTSPSHRREGKTVVAASLAVSLARMGLRVCAVDADLRDPGLAQQFGLDPGAAGLAELIRGAPLGTATQRFSVEDASGRGANGNRAPDGPVLSVITPGREITDPAEMLAGASMTEILERLDAEFDVVIIDCPPILASSDALSLFEHASGTILVARHFQTARHSVVRAAQIIEGAQGSVIGLVGTGVPRGEISAEGYGPSPVASVESARAL